MKACSTYASKLGSTVTGPAARHVIEFSPGLVDWNFATETGLTLLARIASTFLTEAP